METGNCVMFLIGTISGIIFLNKASNLWAHGTKQQTVTSICMLNSLLTICLLTANVSGRVRLCAGSTNAQNYFLAVGTLISAYFLTKLLPAYINLKGKDRSVLITGKEDINHKW